MATICAPIIVQDAVARHALPQGHVATGQVLRYRA